MDFNDLKKLLKNDERPTAFKAKMGLFGLQSVQKRKKRD